MPVGDDDCRYLGEVKIRPKGRERREGQAEIESPLVNNRFAYAPAIAIGAVVATLRW